MRILCVLFAFLLICSVAGCGEESDSIIGSERGSSPLVASWHARSQNERNKQILHVALDDLGVNVGESCKEWVRDVIEEASNRHVTIPSNTLSGDRWQPDLTGHVILERYNANPALLNTQPGYIVQMQWKPGVGSDDSEYNMHTAIVLSVFSDGVIFIESNYDNTPKNNEDAVVNIRYVLENEFKEKVQSFSVYYIQ